MTYEDCSSRSLTLEDLEEAAKILLRSDWRPPPPLELHSLECPKITTNGGKACRCGTSPLEGVFEDALGETSK